MFVETITAPGEVWRHWTDRLRLFAEPPDALSSVRRVTADRTG